MIFYSVGSAAGSIASTAVYAWAGWTAVCLLGATISATALAFWALTLAHHPATTTAVSTAVEKRDPHERVA